jgi:phage terminase large subunit GpA-like protein
VRIALALLLTMLTTLGDELLWFTTAVRAPKLRTMRAFAEEEIWVADGPAAGERFSCKKQPFAGLLFDEVDSGRWRRFAVTGSVQSGKTLVGTIIPCLYHLFECNEGYIFGLPDMDMAADKWRIDLEPSIRRTRYAELLPVDGAGSRGGKVRSITFRNGATLRFMSGGGGDKSRAGYTGRVVGVTEVDGMDESGSTSREADKVTQLEARTNAYDHLARIYLECSVSTVNGRIWQEVLKGSNSRIALRCPYCRRHGFLERKHLVGWQDAANEVEAAEGAAFVCHTCGEIWSEADRRWANEQAKLVHRGQTITEEGVIEGPPPPTYTLGFRWDATNNLLVKASTLGAKEWLAPRSEDAENKELELRQYVWTLPQEPDKWEDTPLTFQAILERTVDLGAGIVPAWAEVVTVGIDLGKFLCHWIGTAWSADGTGQIFKYGRVEVASDLLGVERALALALEEFRDTCEQGWPDESGAMRLPNQVWIDCGFMPDTVCAFVRSKGGARYRPVRGLGGGQEAGQHYGRPKSTGNVVVHLGDGYHVVKDKQRRCYVVDVDSDQWKTWAHRRLATPLINEHQQRTPGSLALHAGDPREHLPLAKHLTAEKSVQEFVPDRGVVTRWLVVSRINHWFDALYNACAAAHLSGVRINADAAAAAVVAAPARPTHRFMTPDGREYLITERKDS